MNFIDARITADSRWAMLPSGERLPLANETPAGLRNREIILGIRPEHFAVMNADAAQLRVDVDHVETRGADTLVYGNPKGAHTKLTLRLPDVHHFEVAITLSLSVDPLRVHLFDPQSERRIGN